MVTTNQPSRCVNLMVYDILFTVNLRYLVPGDPEGSIIRTFTDYISPYLITPALSTNSGLSKRKILKKYYLQGK
jgi:hypothetical protein